MTWLLCCTWALAAPEMIPEESADLMGRTAPNIEATLQDGAAFSLEAVRGKPVVLSFWASWCGPCRAELPALDAFQKAHPEVQVYAVNVDRDQRRAGQFLKAVSFDLPIVWDNSALSMGQYNVMSMPTMFLIDAQGTVKWRKTGFGAQNGLSELETALGALP